MRLSEFFIFILPFLAVSSLSLTSLRIKPADNDSESCPTIVSRAEWKAKPPKGRTDLETPVPYVILHHTAWDECFNFSSCAAMMRKIQDFHQTTRGWDDIGYNFCVGEDGRIYEGRGWDTVGAHAPWYNFRSIGICMMGNFDKKVPNQASIDAVSSLIKCTIENSVKGGAYSHEVWSWKHYSHENLWKPLYHTCQLSGFHCEFHGLGHHLTDKFSEIEMIMLHHPTLEHQRPTPIQLKLKELKSKGNRANFVLQYGHPQDPTFIQLKNKVMSNYTLYGHRQVRNTTCPGDDLFQEIQSWPHWKPGKHYPPTGEKNDTPVGDV